MGVQKKIALILGDGIGPEVTGQSIKVLNAIAKKFGHSFQYAYGLMGADAIDKTGDPLPQETLDVCQQSDAILFGAIGHPKYEPIWAELDRRKAVVFVHGAQVEPASPAPDPTLVVPIADVRSLAHFS